MKLVVDTDEMHSVSQKLTQLSEEYSTLYSSLVQKASTMGDAWKAPDNIAYVDQIQGFLDDLQAMTKHIEQSAQALEQQAVNYETVCENNVTGVKKLVN